MRNIIAICLICWLLGCSREAPAVHSPSKSEPSKQLRAEELEVLLPDGKKQSIYRVQDPSTGVWLYFDHELCALGAVK